MGFWFDVAGSLTFRFELHWLLLFLSTVVLCNEASIDVAGLPLRKHKEMKLILVFTLHYIL